MINPDNKILGSCTDSEDPDLWYPNWPLGRPTPLRIADTMQRVARAIDICDSCTEKEFCLDEGMKPINLTEGIWGGLLPGERLEMAGYTLESVSMNSDEGRAMAFASRAEPWVRW